MVTFLPVETLNNVGLTLPLLLDKAILTPRVQCSTAGVDRVPRMWDQLRWVCVASGSGS